MWTTNPTPTGGLVRMRRVYLTQWIGILAFGCLSLVVWVVVCVLLSTNATAAPAAPVEVTLEQPGGKTFAAKPWGDEWTNGFETLKGFTVVRSRESGAWEYAEEGPEGGLRASGRKVALEEPPSGAEEHLRPEEDASSDASRSSGLGSTEMASPTKASSNLGTQRSLVILVEFTNQASLGSSRAQWRSRFFGTSNSVRDYYDEVSYGKLDIAPAAESHGTFNDGIVGWLALNRYHPNTDGNTGFANQQLTRAAVVAADRYVNFKRYDKDGNGHLRSRELHVTVVAAGKEASYSAGGRSVWAHQWCLGITGLAVDGVRFGDCDRDGGYTQVGEWHGDHMATLGVMVHELGHDLNLPDLYDTDYSSEGIGEWSVMAKGSWLELPGAHVGSKPSHPDAWSKWYEGWLTPRRVRGTGVPTSIPRAETSATATIQLRPNPFGVDWTRFGFPGRGEYFLVENRQRVGYDAALPGTGLLVWHIDETQTATNDANADEERKLVDLEEADGLRHLDKNRNSGGNRGDAGDPYPGTSGNTVFDAGSDPNSLLYDGTPSGVAISGISASSASMSATITAP